MRKRTILISVAVVMVWNVALAFTWQATFPRFPLMPKNLSATVTQDEDQPVVVRDLAESPAGVLTSQLLDLFTLPTGWTLVDHGAGFSGSILDSRCPSPSIPSPVVSRSISFTHSGSSGGLAEISIYSAGLGALAMDRIRHQVLSCAGVWRTGDLGIGTESLAINDDGGVYSSGPAGRTVWVRVGDIVTMVALRGYGIYSADNIAKLWVTSWKDTLALSACPNQNSALTDIVRSPLSNKFKGWSLSQRVSLDSSELALANAHGVTLAVNAATSMNSTNIAMPKEKIINPPVKILTTYPLNLLISYPSGRPALSLSETAFPLKPQGIVVSTRQPDPIGPGCGWALTGQEAPPFLYQIEFQNAQKLIAQNHVDLSNQWSSWLLERWRYGWLNDQYLSQLTAWNNWVTSANLAIASAWWNDYDTKMIVYNIALADYDNAYATWSATACPTPSDSPTPLPSDTASSISPSPVPSTSPTPLPSDTAPSVLPSSVPSLVPSLVPASSEPTTPLPTPSPSICTAPGEPINPIRPVGPSISRP